MFVFLSSLLFLACPTPPEQQTENRSLSNGPNNAPNNNAQNGNNQNPPENPPQNPPPGEENKGNPEEKKAENNNGDPPAAKNPEDPTADPIITQANPEQEKPEMVKESILIRVDRIPPKPIKPKNIQEDVKRGDHAVFKGEIKCKKCDDSLLLRVVPFIGPDDQQFDHSLITHKRVEVGEFEIAVPKSEKPVVLELLVDKDKNDAPSGGEYFAVVDMGGSLIPTKNHDDLVLDGTKRDFFEAPPSPGTKAAE